MLFQWLTLLLFVAVSFAELSKPPSNRGVVLRLTRETVEQAVQENHMIIAFFMTGCHHCAVSKNEYYATAEKLSGNINPVIFAEYSIDDPEGRYFPRQFGIKSVPSVLWIEKGGKSNVTRSGYIGKSEFSSWILRSAEKVIERKVERRSTNDVIKMKLNLKTPVILSDSNITSVVMNPKLNVLVKFYAPWCNYCKNLVHPYNMLSEAFKDVKDVIIAELDCTRNYWACRHFVVKFYPTISLFIAGSDNKTAFGYEGSRSLNDMVDFINRETGTFMLPNGKVDPNGGVVFKFEGLVENLLLLQSVQDRKQYFEAVIVPESEKFSTRPFLHRLYIDLLRRIAERDNYWISTEITRLGTIIKRRKDVTPDKIVYLTKQYVVLTHFLKKAPFIAAIDHLLLKFFSISDPMKQLSCIESEFFSVVDEDVQTHPSFAAYLVLLQKVVENGHQWISTELKSLGEIISKSEILTPEKRKETFRHAAILEHFSLQTALLNTATPHLTNFFNVTDPAARNALIDKSFLPDTVSFSNKLFAQKIYEVLLRRTAKFGNDWIIKKKSEVETAIKKNSNEDALKLTSLQQQNVILTEFMSHLKILTEADSQLKEFFAIADPTKRKEYILQHFTAPSETHATSNNQMLKTYNVLLNHIVHHGNVWVQKEIKRINSVLRLWKPDLGKTVFRKISDRKTVLAHLKTFVTNSTTETADAATNDSEPDDEMLRLELEL